jgi:hypothetical protein
MSTENDRKETLFLFESMIAGGQ